MITDRTAQRIASEWHGGQTSALYALSSSGAILDVAGIVYELTGLIQAEHAIPPDQRDDPMTFTNLVDLRAYVRKHGPRGPIDGWYESTIAGGS